MASKRVVVSSIPRSNRRTGVKGISGSKSSFASTTEASKSPADTVDMGTRVRIILEVQVVLGNTHDVFLNKRGLPKEIPIQSVAKRMKAFITEALTDYESHEREAPLYADNIKEVTVTNKGYVRG